MLVMRGGGSARNDHAAAASPSSAAAATGRGQRRRRDFATAIGPWIVTKDELAGRLRPSPKGNVLDARMTAHVNGVPVSDGNVAQMDWTFAEIVRLRKEPPPEEELAGIRAYTAGLFVLRNSSPRGILGQFAFMDTQGLPENYLNTYVEKVNAVTRADVQRLAETYLDPGKMAIVVVGDKAAVEESLQPYRK